MMDWHEKGTPGNRDYESDFLEIQMWASSPFKCSNEKMSDQKPEPRPGTLTTAIHIPRSTWELLREVAFVRAKNDGGRASVSKLLVSIVEEQRKRLEAEISREKN